MTQFLKTLLFALVCLHCGSLRAEECIFMSLEEIEDFSLKNYVKPEQIYLSDDRIFVQTSEDLLPVQSLMADAFGLYYKVDASQKNDRWTCPACRNENDRPCRSACNTCEWPANHNLDLQCDIKGSKDQERRNTKEARDQEYRKRREAEDREHGVVRNRWGELDFDERDPRHFRYDDDVLY